MNGKEIHTIYLVIYSGIEKLETFCLRYTLKRLHEIEREIFFFEIFLS